MVVDRRLLALVPDAHGHMARAVLWQWLAVLGDVLIALGISRSIDLLFAKGLAPDISAAGLVILGCILRVLGTRIGNAERFRLSRDGGQVLRSHLYEKLLSLGVAGTSSLNTAEVVQLADEGCVRIEDYLRDFLPELPCMVVVPITLFAVLFVSCATAALVLLAVSALAPVVLALRARALRAQAEDYWRGYADLADEFLEGLRGLTTLKTYQADKAYHEHMDSDSRKLGKQALRFQTRRLRGGMLIDLLAFGGAAAAAGVVLLEMSRGTCELSSAALVILLATEFLMPARHASETLFEAMMGLAAARRGFELLDIAEPPEDGMERPEPGDHLAMNDVSFGFEPDRTILSHVTLDVPAVGLTAIVGESGSGKTTIARLLMGELSGYSGEIYLGGRPLEGFSRRSLARYVTVVTSHSRILGGTVRDNLLIGDPFASPDEMWAILDSVSLGDYLRSRDGLDTDVGDGGAKFSGGQRQRLALARALLHNSPVYILDEATSNIDVVSEDAIMASIRGVARYKAVVVITHRLANVAGAARIYVLDDGRVAGAGTHGELLASCKTYRALWRNQRDLEAYAQDVAPTVMASGSQSSQSATRDSDAPWVSETDEDGEEDLHGQA